MGKSVIGVVIAIVLLAFPAVCWIGNAVKLAQCDWLGSGSWKGEVIHSVGVVVPPAAMVTVWFDDK